MKTRAVAAEEAADAPCEGLSEVEAVTVVPSFEAWALIASYGAIKYCKICQNLFSSPIDPEIWTYWKFRGARSPAL